MKKAIAIILALVCLSILFSSCGSDSKENATNTSIVSSTTPTILATTISKPIATKEPQQNYAIGTIVHFGPYDWQVLAVENGKLLLITEDAIERRGYHFESTGVYTAGVTWETCTLRAYLNGKFLEKFSAQEQARILEINNTNGDNQWHGTNGGNDTNDKVFLLSLEEVLKYFGDSGQLKINNPDSMYFINDRYNEKRMAKFNGDWTWWWLRSPGNAKYGAAYVGVDGYIYPNGNGVFDTSSGVRPALWLKIN